jgi:hypothetical protein
MRAILLALFLLHYSAAHAEIIRCNATTKWAGSDVIYRLDILVGNEKDNAFVALADDEKVTDVLSSVRKGIAEVTVEVAGGFRKPERFTLVQTQNPKPDGWSLIGFFLDQGNVTVVRADLWDEGKPFYLYDTYFSGKSIAIGSCE